jgi:hypothetical protein
MNSFKYIPNEVKLMSKNVYQNTLTIFDLNKEDTNSSYECEAVNSLGSNRFSIELVEMSVPEEPTELKLIQANSQMITISWMSGFDGGLPQIFTIKLNDTLIDIDRSDNQIFNSNGDLITIVSDIADTNLIHLTNLEPNSLYLIKVISRNNLGSSSFSNPLIVHTDEITNEDINFLPIFDTLFLNVPKNRLEYTYKKSTQLIKSQISNSTIAKDIESALAASIRTCFRIELVRNDFDKYQNIKTCLKNDIKHQNQQQQQHRVNQLFLFDNFDKKSLEIIDNDAGQLFFNSKQVKEMKVSICFEKQTNVCTVVPTNAIIGNFI